VPASESGRAVGGPRRCRRAAFLPGEHPVVRRLAGRRALPVSARATAGPLAAFPALVRGLGDVRQQCELPRALDGAGDLALMAAARSRDPRRADLAALGDEPAQRRNVLVVDLVDPCHGSTGRACADQRPVRPSCRAGGESAVYVALPTGIPLTVWGLLRYATATNKLSGQAAVSCSGISDQRRNRPPGPRPRTPSPTRLMIRQDKRNSRSTRRSGTERQRTALSLDSWAGWAT
jgi:hypothetical protein